MKCTLSWLRKYTDCDLDSTELVRGLTMAGLEVDSCQELFADLIDSVRVVKILSVVPHPQADRLVICEVDLTEKKLRVVCGAPNAKPGMVTALALPGAVLPSGLEIKSSNIRGEVSEGMLCSEKDLGISDNHSGIMDLPSSLVVGDSLIEALSLRDTLLEVDLTPNRPDCASIIGIAREIAGFTGKNLNLPVDKELPVLTGQNLPFSVVVESPACSRYAARLLENVTIAPSPWWLKKALLAVGLRPINNVVDITNFVMLEYGQPLHAFDFDRVSGGKILVRLANPLEKINTLDGIERELDTEMLLICDQEKPLAVAGVMGGASSEVTVSTRRILLESAYFDPISIRRTVRKLNMGTDSSYRFERGVDPEGIPKALERAVKLMVELAGAQVVKDGIDLRQGMRQLPSITLRVKRCKDLLGLDLSADEISKLLAKIEIKTNRVDDDTFSVVPPSFRVDLEREIDLIEEIARLKGYNELPVALPVMPMSFPETDSIRILRNKLASVMIALGFHEAINYSFVSEKHADLMELDAHDKRRAVLCLRNPLAEEQSVMRTSLLPTLLENVRRNINHQTPDIRIFEVGKVFFPSTSELPAEEEYLVAVMSGRRYPAAPVIHFGFDAVDIHDMRGVVEALSVQQGYSALTFDLNGGSGLLGEPGEHVKLTISNNQTVGVYGLIDRKILKNFGIKQDVFFLELNVSMLSRMPIETKKFRSLPRYPSVKWDVALVVPESVKSGELLKAVNEMQESIIEKVEIFDIYQGENIGVGSKSIAISINYRSCDHTLDDEEVGKVHQKIINLLVTRFQGKLREV